MKKSLIKSLLPVLIIVLALSMVTITAFADNYTGFVYDGEEKGTTTDQIFFDGLIASRPLWKLPRRLASSTAWTPRARL